MTPRESEILNIIYRLGGQCSLQVISKKTGLGFGYVFLISKGLLNQKLIKKTANNVFVLTISGRSLLECSRDASEGKKKTPIFLGIPRSFGRSSPHLIHRCGSEVEPSSFEPEISFISPEAIPSGCHGVGKGFVIGQPYLTEHNLSKGQITEVADARSIQKSLRRLIAKGRNIKRLNNPYKQDHE